MAGCIVDFAENIPKSDIDAADGGRAHDAVSMPEVLAIHHLPEVFDASGIFSDEELGNILDGSDHGPGVPFKGGFTPTPEARLVGNDFDKDPVAHARVADQCLDSGYFHETAQC
jgi:hypothetical protein